MLGLGEGKLVGLIPRSSPTVTDNLLPDLRKKKYLLIGDGRVFLFQMILLLQAERRQRQTPLQYLKTECSQSSVPY